MKIEICLDSVESVLAAEKGGASRVEFCSDLFEGGLTPTLGAFKTAKKYTHIPLNVMIRPRGGDFCYTELEFETMMNDASIFKEAGADALVFGLLTKDGRIDKERTSALIDIARPLPVTFHRAFDMTRDPFEALEDLITLQVDRILTSGHEPSVPEGLPLLLKLIEQAGSRIIIMPGAGINERNFTMIHTLLQASEYHVYLHSETNSSMEYRPEHIYMGGVLRQPEFLLQNTDSTRVHNVVNMVRS
ncbi:MAG: copper homeostasis protein CutC [Spirochaetia bacterium]|nr:copper homeostasis protein CutC [Spirochaetia bacterium]